MEIKELLDRLEETLTQATRVPLTGKVMVEADELLAVIDEMREALPQEIREAGRVARDREQLLTDARSEAAATVEEARAHAAKLLSEHTLTQEAQQQAEEVIDNSKRIARQIYVNALQRVDELFESLEPDLTKAREDLQKTYAELEKAHGGVERAQGSVRKWRQQLREQM